MALAPRRHRIKIAEVVVERAIEIQNSFFVEVTMDLLLVAIKDSDQEIRRRGEGLPASIKDPYL